MPFALLAVLVLMDIGAAFVFWITWISQGHAPTMIVAGLLLACVSLFVARQDAPKAAGRRSAQVVIVHSKNPFALHAEGIYLFSNQGEKT